VQVHVTAKQHAFWLRKLLRRRQRVELPGDRLELVPSSRKHSCQGITPGLGSDLLGITQQTPQRVLAPAVLVTGDGARTCPFPVPVNPLGLARSEAGQQIIDAENGQRRQIHSQKAFAAQPQHLDHGTTVGTKNRFGCRCSGRPAVALKLTIVA